MNVIVSRVKTVFREHKTEMLIVAGIGFVLGNFFGGLIF